jgi:uncharacterized RDD family membrane protein YckC
VAGPAVAPFPLASWGSRAAARLLDLLILSVLLLPLAIALLWGPFSDFINTLPADGRAPSEQAMAAFYSGILGRVIFLTAVSLVIQFAYEVPQTVLYGQTLGKRALHIKVRPLAEDRLPSWLEGVLRWGVIALGSLIGGGLFLLIDYLFPLWDRPWQQAIHDKAAKTIVVPAR